MMRFILLFMLLFLSSCFFEVQEEKKLVEYNVSKEVFIGEFNQFLSEIKNSNENVLDNFVIDSINKSDKNSKIVHLFGEHHLDKDGIKKTLSYIIQLAKKGPVKVLIEGTGREKSASTLPGNLVTIQHFFWYFLLQKYVDLNGVSNYNPVALDNWIAAHTNYIDIVVQSILDEKLLVQGMSIPQIRFDGWDKEVEVPYSFEGLVMRNKSLVDGIAQENDKVQLVVLAGFMHLPLGDYLNYQKNKDQRYVLNPDYARFYTELSKDRSHKNGSSEIIYSSALQNGWALIQAIPKSSLRLNGISKW